MKQKTTVIFSPKLKFAVFSFFLIFAAAIIFSGLFFQQKPIFAQGPEDDVVIESPLEWNSISDFIKRFIDFALYAGLVLLPLIILVLVYYYLTIVGGDPERMKRIKTLLIYTCIGFVVILLAKALIYVIM